PLTQHVSACGSCLLAASRRPTGLYWTLGSLNTPGGCHPGIDAEICRKPARSRETPSSPRHPAIAWSSALQSRQAGTRVFRFARGQAERIRDSGCSIPPATAWLRPVPPIGLDQKVQRTAFLSSRRLDDRSAD